MEEKKNEKKDRKSLIVLLIMLILAGGGYYYYMNFYLDQPIKGSPYVGTYEKKPLDWVIELGDENIINEHETIILNEDGTGKIECNWYKQDPYSVNIRWADTEYGFKIMYGSDEPAYYTKLDNIYVLYEQEVTNESELEECKQRYQNAIDPQRHYYHYFVKIS